MNYLIDSDIIIYSLKNHWIVINNLALRTILWMRVQLSAVKEYARSGIRKISKASHWCFYKLNWLLIPSANALVILFFGIG